MTIECVCGQTLLLSIAPAFGQADVWQECQCGARYSTKPGEAGTMLPVCEGIEEG